VIKYKKPSLINFSIYPQYNGTLIPFYTNVHFPKSFILKRFFILYGKSKHFRADHAHKKCSQIIIPLRGRISITIKGKNYLRNFELSKKKKKGITIPPYNWIKINFQNNEDSLLTLCNYKYDKKEYISNFTNFQKIISK
tara:strand:- start:154 stop:570 length:417 start_codon:yes stop_codon:yes gene_type:complete